MSDDRTLEQQRAAHALGRARALEKESFASEYRRYVDALPATIVMSGLGQALAMERASAPEESEKREARAHGALYESVESWLTRREGVYAGAGDVLEAITGQDQDHYLLAQAESLAWLEWHKKFCRAFIPKTPEGPA